MEQGNLFKRQEMDSQLKPKQGVSVALEGDIDSVRLINEASGWGFGTLFTGRHERVNFTGIVENLYGGADVRLEGTWTEHAQFGWQVKVEKIEIRMPDNRAGVVAWLCHRMPDVGPVRAQRLVATIPPPELWTVLGDGDVERIVEEVPGIGETIAGQICDAYQTWAYEREQFATLAQYGLRPEQIRDAVSRWYSKASDVLQENPYRVRELPRIGFKQADAIARKMGVKRLDERRIHAGLGYAAEVQERQGGHCCQTKRKLISIAASGDVLNLRSKNVAPRFESAVAAGELVEAHGLYYRPFTAQAEDIVATTIVRLLDPEGANS